MRRRDSGSQGTRRAAADLILSHGTPTTATLLQQTRTIRSVFRAVSDPIGSGFVASFRSRGQRHRLHEYGTDDGRQVDRDAQEIAPPVARVALLFNPATAPYAENWLNPFKAAAASFGIQGTAALVHDTSELEPVLAAQAREPNGGLIVMPDTFTTPVVRRLQHWRHATASRPSIRSDTSLNPAACCPTELIWS